ncbi:MAG: prepilin-type N-terminal cleavage/methylation domain-containing protein [Elusimicrobiaceae bacterium]|nr:prepilin-type N-terminal cleavage/methylation domain-containing protein [Elusimicrobiaceae bacterium]
MKNKKGFTLTEVLLAVMIVGLISISLAALTRSAARESGVGRSKVMMRNNLSRFMRTLRADLQEATRVDECALCAADGDNGVFEVGAGDTVKLLRLTKNQMRDGNPVLEQITTQVGSTSSTEKKTVLYCFENGTETSNVVPEGAIRGGKIYRYEYPTAIVLTCDEAKNSGEVSKEVALSHVKYIPSIAGYAVPMIGRRSFSREGINSMLRVNIITELDSVPVVNETVEETFVAPIGY